MNRKIRILFGSEDVGSFIDRDYEILTKYFDVRFLRYKVNSSRPIESLKVFFNLISNIYWADVSFSWFAGSQAYTTTRLCKIFNKKSVVVVGGYEVAKIPEIHYGALLNPRTYRTVRYIFENATKVLTVDDELKNEAMINFQLSGSNIITIPTGFDVRKITPYGQKERVVLSVAIANSEETVKLKGLDTFVLAASVLRDIKFILIGVKGDALKILKNIASPNVEFIEYLYVDAIVPHFQKSKVYCQLSMREGHPNALCEAMLCECIPVGTNVQGIRSVIDNTGFLVPYGDVDATASAITKALECDNGKNVRKRIVDHYSIERRERELISLIEKLNEKGI